MSSRNPVRCVLVDPSLFTAPYDAALTDGLLAAGVEPLWVTRPTRRGDEQELPSTYVAPLFYTRSDELSGWLAPLRPALKGLDHLVGLARLFKLVSQFDPHVVHFQWTVLPLLDAMAVLLLRWRCPVVLTVHDPVPFNGERQSLAQRLGFDLPIRLADRVIVHTRSGRHTLVRRGIPAQKIVVIPHGPLRLQIAPQARSRQQRDPRWTFVLFGQIKPYKGLDVLVEALALLSPEIRQQTRVIVAGRPYMSVDGIQARIRQLGLEDVIELRLERLSEQEMADLFALADCFVFPYREIDASGVYFLAKPLGKWLIASRVGVFVEDMREGVDGALVPSGETRALSAALREAILERPSRPRTSVNDSWNDIGRATRLLYEEAICAPALQPRFSQGGDADV